MCLWQEATGGHPLTLAESKMKPLESSVLAAELAAIDAIHVALELAEKRGSISISTLLLTKRSWLEMS